MACGLTMAADMYSSTWERRISGTKKPPPDGRRSDIALAMYRRALASFGFVMARMKAGHDRAHSWESSTAPGASGRYRAERQPPGAGGGPASSSRLTVTSVMPGQASFAA